MQYTLSPLHVIPLHDRRWLLPPNKKLDSDARARYEKLDLERPQWLRNEATPTEKTTAPAQEKTKKGKSKTYVDLPAGKRVYFLIDCETTGSKRNWDRGIEYCIMAHDESGKHLDTFLSRVNNDGVRIKPAAYSVHGI